MKLIAKLFRVTTIRTAELIAAVGKDPLDEISGPELALLVRQKFRPLAPRFQFWTSGSKTIVGIEVMSFDIQDANFPMAGLVQVDPIAPHEIDRVDGALESELNRMGCGTDFDGYEYRMSYELKGN